MTIQKFLSICCICLALGGCIKSDLTLDPTEGKTPKQLFDEGKSASRDKRYETAAEFFQALTRRYPFGHYAQQAELELIFIYYKTKEPDLALISADRFIRNYPAHPSVPYAHYMKGVINMNRGVGLLDSYFDVDKTKRDPKSMRDAFFAFKTVVEKFPNSRYAESAKERMTVMRNALARHELAIVNFYMGRNAYVSAINRANYLIETYQGAPAVKDALFKLAESYKALAMDVEYKDTIRIIELNYPKQEESKKS